MNRRIFLKYAGVTAAVVEATALGLSSLQSHNAFTPAPVSETATSAALSGLSSLRAVAQANSMLGAAVFPGGLQDSPYADTLGREFNFLTPENAMKWAPLDQRGFEPADILVNFASSHGMKVKGHTLIWHNQLPQWVNAQISSDELRRVMRDHVRDVVGHFKGKVHAWDVVNEAVDDREGLRKTLFLQKLGEGYIAEAFRIAREVDPDAVLIYNDYGAEGLGGKSDRVYALLKKLLDVGAPVDAVGLQMRISAAKYPEPEGIAANVRRLAGLGLKVNISEMDVRIRDAPGGLAEKNGVTATCIP